MLEALAHVELIRLNGTEEFGLGPRGGLGAAEAAALRVLNRYPITRLDDLHIYQQRERAILARLVQEPVAPYDLVIGFMEWAEMADVSYCTVVDLDRSDVCT